MEQASQEAYFAVAANTRTTRTAAERAPRTNHGRLKRGDCEPLPFSGTISHVVLFAGNMLVAPRISVFSKTNITYNEYDRVYEHNRRNNLDFEMSFSLSSFAMNRQVNIYHKNEYWKVDRYLAGLSAVKGGDPHAHDASGRTTLISPTSVGLREGNQERQENNYRYGDPSKQALQPKFHEDLERLLSFDMQQLARTEPAHYAFPSFPNYYQSSAIAQQLLQSPGAARAMINGPAYTLATTPFLRHHEGQAHTAAYNAAGSYQAHAQDPYGAGSSYDYSALQPMTLPSYGLPLQSGYHDFTDVSNYTSDPDAVSNSPSLAGLTPIMPVTSLTPQPEAPSSSAPSKARWHHLTLMNSSRNGNGWDGVCFVGSLYTECSRTDQSGHKHHARFLIAQAVSVPLCVQGRSPSYLRAAAARRRARAGARR